MTRGTPAGGSGTPDAIAHAAVYPASDEAAFVHGSLIDAASRQPRSCWPAWRLYSTPCSAAAHQSAQDGVCRVPAEDQDALITWERTLARLVHDELIADTVALLAHGPR